MTREEEELQVWVRRGVDEDGIIVFKGTEACILRQVEHTVFVYNDGERGRASFSEIGHESNWCSLYTPCMAVECLLTAQVVHIARKSGKEETVAWGSDSLRSPIL